MKNEAWGEDFNAEELFLLQNKARELFLSLPDEEFDAYVKKHCEDAPCLIVEGRRLVCECIGCAMEEKKRGSELAKELPSFPSLSKYCEKKSVSAFFNAEFVRRRLERFSFLTGEGEV